MLASFTIGLREGLEAALIVGLLLAAVRKAGAPTLARSIWQGVFAAVAVSLVAGVALFVTVGELPETAGRRRRGCGCASRGRRADVHDLLDADTGRAHGR